MPPVLFDSHAHLTDPAYAADLADVIDHARDTGVAGLVVVGYDVETSEAAVELTSRFPGTWAAVGIHPNHGGEASAESLARLEDMATATRVVAIGECGLDYYHDRTGRDVQRAAFLAQIDIARRARLPVVVHCRDAMADTLAMLGGTPLEHGGVMHCFDGTADDAAVAIARGLAISVAGPVTYRKDQTLARAVATVPLDRLMIETDCPYLSPVGFRGRRNEPARVGLVALAVARIRGESLETVAAATTGTACRVFGITALG